MHHAPAVRYPVGRSRFHLLLMLMLGLLGACALTGWMVVQDRLSWRHMASWAVWLVALSWAGWAWWRSPQGELAYGSAGWTWTRLGQISGVVVCVELDLQHALLLRAARPAHAPLWLWLERRQVPTRWQAVRRAVFAPTPTAAAQAGQEHPA